MMIPNLYQSIGKTNNIMSNSLMSDDCIYHILNDTDSNMDKDRIAIIQGLKEPLLPGGAVPPQSDSHVSTSAGTPWSHRSS